MIDAHCHLNFHCFKAIMTTVIKRAFAKGVTKIINTGTQIRIKSRSSKTG